MKILTALFVLLNIISCNGQDKKNENQILENNKKKNIKNNINMFIMILKM